MGGKDEMDEDKFEKRNRNLTELEVAEVLDMIEEGVDDKTIAKQFNIDIKTVSQLRNDWERDI